MCAAAAIVAALGVVVTGQVPQKRADPQRPVFRSGTNLVVVDAYPRLNGRILEGLTADDFEVFEDNKPQKIEQFDFVRAGDPTENRPEASAGQAIGFAAEPRSRVFLAYLDVDHVTMRGSQNIQSPLVDLLDRAMGARDLFGVVTSRRPMDVRFGRSMLSLSDQFGAYGTWGVRDGKIPDPAMPEERAIAGCGFEAGLADMLIGRLRQARAITGLEQVVNFVTQIRETRTFILVVTEGWALEPVSEKLLNDLTASTLKNKPAIGVKNGRLGTGQTQAEARDPCLTEALHAASIDLRAQFTSLIDWARRGNVTFYPVSPNGLNVPAIAGRSMTGVSMDDLLSLAHDSDGEVFLKPADFKAGLSTLAGDISAYYLLGYSSPNNKPDGQIHTIRVRVKQPRGVSVAARRSYRSPTAEEVAATALMNKPEPNLVPEFGEALGRIVRRTPDAPLLTEALQWGTSGEILVAVELASGLQARGTWTRGADVHVTVTAEVGDRTKTVVGRIDPGARATLVRVRPDTDSGVWRVGVRVTGPDGELSDRLIVQETHGMLLDDPLISRATAAIEIPPQPAADPVFRRTERLHVEWPIVTSLDRRGVRVLDNAGRPVALSVEVTDRVSLGRPVLAVDATLAALVPGDYVIEVTASRGADTEQRFVAVRVVR
jgi:VWFA-related protein